MEGDPEPVEAEYDHSDRFVGKLSDWRLVARVEVPPLSAADDDEAE
jgi:hypothetical protein